MKTTTKTVTELIETKESPLPLEVIPNNMGINLCSVDALTWTRQEDGQLVSLTIHFVPAPNTEKQAAKTSGENKRRKQGVNTMKIELLKNIVKRLLFPRLYWECRAKALWNNDGWFVGCTDMYSYLDGGYVHYAYSPINCTPQVRVGFRGCPVSALRKAVRFAERMNRQERWGLGVVTQTNCHTYSIIKRNAQ